MSHRADPKRRWPDLPHARIPIAPLIYFRIVFGAIMVWEVGRFFAYGWIGSHFLTGRFAFKYYGFEWVQAWPGRWLFVHFGVVGLAAVGITLGVAYRLSSIVFFLGFTYIYLLDQMYYLNHLYLVCLLSFLLMFMPAHRAVSIDALRRPEIRATHAPAWTLFLLRFQVGLVYFFGGVAKLNGDWLRGEPIRSWLMSRSDWPVIGGFLGREAAVWIICYGGLLLDLFVVPLLLWRRTRWLAVAGLIVFHLGNFILFHIGIFPWLMLAATPLFFPPAWWSRVTASQRSTGILPVNGGTGILPVESGADIPVAAATVPPLDRGAGVPPAPQPDALAGAGAESPGEKPSREPDAPSRSYQEVEATPANPWPATADLRLAPRAQWADAYPAIGAGRRRVVAGLVGAYVLVQILMPLRHFLYPGVVHWTEEGHRFSWHMKLRAKRAHIVEFLAYDPDRRLEWRVPTEPYLSRRFLRRAATRPDMVVQLAHRIARDLRERGHPNVEVRVRVVISLNDHPAQSMIDPNVDLARVEPSLRPADWILPLRTRAHGPPTSMPLPVEPEDAEP